MDNNKKDKAKYDYKFKIIILGNGEVGKTSILISYTDGYFSSNYLSTIGLDERVKYININSKKVKIILLDTAGQERYHTVTSAFYKGADGIILVYSIDNRDSFKGISRWLKDIKENVNTEIDVVLVGNKCDMEDKREVPEDEGKDLAEKSELPFFETSAKNTTNIHEAFDCLINKIYERKKNVVAKPAESFSLKKEENKKPNKGCCNKSK